MGGRWAEGIKKKKEKSFISRLFSLLLREAISCSQGAYELALGVLPHQNHLGRAQAAKAPRVLLSPYTVRSEAVALTGTLASLLPRPQSPTRSILFI